MWFPQGTTPAKAASQLGGGGNYALPAVTTAFPTGPRPSPGWCWGVGRRDAQILSSAPGKSKKKAASQQEPAQRSGQWIPQNPPRRRPGPSWGTEVTTCCPPLLQPSQLGPGLRRGGAGDWLRDRHASEARRAKTPPPNLSVRAGRRRGVAASGGGRGEAAVPDRHDRNARRNRGSPGSPCHHKSGNRARRDGRAAICRCGR